MYCSHSLLVVVPLESPPGQLYDNPDKDEDLEKQAGGSSSHRGQVRFASPRPSTESPEKEERSPAAAPGRAPAANRRTPGNLENVRDLNPGIMCIHAETNLP